MRVQLYPHPATPRPDLTLEVEARRAGGVLSLEYRLGGALATVRWPEPQARRHTDDLWRATCFEAFIATGDEAYVEFNLSPSGAWAAYAFSAYRDGMRPLEISAPAMAVRHSGDAFALTADLVVPEAFVGPISLSAVIEGLNGEKTYWALAHPSDKPDFHHPDSRVLDLT